MTRKLLITKQIPANPTIKHHLAKNCDFTGTFVNDHSQPLIIDYVDLQAYIMLYGAFFPTTIGRHVSLSGCPSVAHAEAHLA